MSVKYMVVSGRKPLFKGSPYVVIATEEYRHGDTPLHMAESILEAKGICHALNESFNSGLAIGQQLGKFS